MKVFTRFFDPKILEAKLDSLKHLDFSLFIDDVPKSQEDLSSTNIITLVEPNEYFGLHDWVLQNQQLFQCILTWDDKLLNNCEQATYLAFGSSWLKEDQYIKIRDKKFEIAHLSGVLNKSYGQSMRHEIISRKNEFKIPTNFYTTIGDRHNLDDARLGKETVFGDSQYGIVIENFSHRGFFTEKLIDCFLLKTIPIYWGCSNIGNYFDRYGILEVNNVDDIIHTCNWLKEREDIKPGSGVEYNLIATKEAIENNYQKALSYIDYEQNVCNKVIEIFQHNNLV